jgi:hypothetical protein
MVATTTSNVTIHVCNGVIGGPCLDPIYNDVVHNFNQNKAHGALCTFLIYASVNTSPVLLIRINIIKPIRNAATNKYFVLILYDILSTIYELDSLTI